MVRRYTPNQQHELRSVLNVLDGQSRRRRILIWFDDAGQPLSGAIEWYVEHERVETTVVAAGPFEGAPHFLLRLLEEQRLQLPLDID